MIDYHCQAARIVRKVRARQTQGNQAMNIAELFVIVGTMLGVIVWSIVAIVNRLR